jgi:UrcA family protein
MRPGALLIAMIATVPAVATCRFEESTPRAVVATADLVLGSAGGREALSSRGKAAVSLVCRSARQSSLIQREEARCPRVAMQDAGNEVGLLARGQPPIRLAAR